MTLTKKKITISIIVVIFILTACFALLSFQKKIYASDVDYYWIEEYWEDGTDDGITADDYLSWRDSGDDQGYSPDGYYCDWTYNQGYDWYEYVADQSYNFYSWYEEEGVCYGIEDKSYVEDLNMEWSDSGVDSYAYNGNTRDFEWRLEGHQVASIIRNHSMECAKVWVNEDNNFEFVFWWEYENNNWVQIFDMEGNMVYEIDMEYGKADFEVDLPDGMYKVQTFHEAGKILQEFMIGKP